MSFVLLPLLLAAEIPDSGYVRAGFEFGLAEGVAFPICETCRGAIPGLAFGASGLIRPWEWLGFGAA
jgi:hypothetical protein